MIAKYLPKKNFNDIQRDIAQKCAAFTEHREGQQGCIIKGHEKTIVGDGYAHYLDYSDGFMGVYICLNLSNCTI